VYWLGLERPSVHAWASVRAALSEPGCVRTSKCVIPFRLVCVGSPHTSVGTYHDHLQAWFLACGPFLGLGRNVWVLPGFGVMCDSFQVPAFLFGLRSGFTIPFLAGMLSGCTSVLGWFLPRLVVLPRFLDALPFLCELRRGWSYARASVGWRGPLQAPSLRRETYVRGFPF